MKGYGVLADQMIPSVGRCRRSMTGVGSALLSFTKAVQRRMRVLCMQSLKDPVVVQLPMSWSTC